MKKLMVNGLLTGLHHDLRRQARGGHQALFEDYSMPELTRKELISTKDDVAQKLLCKK
tara:strand:- start:9561 stop:9734 length:174 start_codon:yes stop_codon:yes gene_type:complete